MKRFQTQFNHLKIGLTFSKNGNLWLKRSSRTAEIVATNEPYHGKWFYFSANEPITFTAHDVRDSKSYLTH